MGLPMSMRLVSTRSLFAPVSFLLRRSEKALPIIGANDKRRSDLSSCPIPERHVAKPDETYGGKAIHGMAAASHTEHPGCHP